MATLPTELDKTTNAKLFELALGASDKAVERARTAGTFIQGAAAALGTLYTGILTFAFAVKENPLPARGFIPTFFFALAVALAAFYTAFLSRAEDLEQPATDAAPGGDPLSDEVRMYTRLAWYVTWTDSALRARQTFVRAAVVSLAVGVFLMPVAFLEFPDEANANGDTSEEGSAESTPWPTPEVTDPPELAAVLYEQQLIEFREAAETRDGESATGDAATENAVAIAAGMIGFILVASTLLWPKFPRGIRRGFEDWLEPLE